jgi:phage repressor protein C with HTH and peptisase S24 domain
MYDAAEIYELVEARRRAMGLTQAQVGLLAFGKEDNTAIQSLKKGSSPAMDRIAEMARVLDLELYLGPPRTTPQLAEIALDGEDFAALPLHAAQASAGPGAVDGDDEIVRHLLFRRTWLRDIGVSPRDARLLHVRGDSMQPVIHHGDMVMIDTSRTVPPVATGRRRKQMYVLRDPDDGIRLKWVERPEDNKLVVWSENIAAYGPEVFRKSELGALGFIGQVVWWGHTVRD